MKQFLSTTIALAVASSLLGEVAQAKPEAATTAQQTTQQIAQQVAQQVAQQTADAPQIDRFSVSSFDRLTPGTELVFTLEGTPGSRATLTVGSLARNLPMRETEPGVYEGRYTVRSQDQITQDTIVRGNLQRGNQTASVRLQQALVPSAAQVNPTQPVQSGNSVLTIERFTAQPVQSLEPGTELKFTLTGTPRAAATFSIDGVTFDQPLQETTSGTYEGRYVIRRQDDFSKVNNTAITANLRLNNQAVRSRLDQALVAGTGTSTPSDQLALEILSPQANTRVRGAVEVKGRSAPNATIAVNVRAANSLAGLIGFDQNILTRTIEADAQGNFTLSFRSPVSVPGTRYDISFNATKGTQTKQETLVLYQR
ncbi:MAG TPA: hypothetical protein V6D18_00035 [Thermosynechococcaceae cyanobacterium]